MPSFENAMNEWLDAVGGLTNLTIEERETVNKAGAEVLNAKLAESAKDKHYQLPARNGHSKRGVAHLADSVISGQLEGQGANGDIAVGFAKNGTKGDGGKSINHARIARFLNDGTVKMQGDHFWEQAIQESSDEVLDAQAKALMELQERKFGKWL